MQFPAKVQKSCAVYKMIKPARLVQECFETSILYTGEPQASLVQELPKIGKICEMFLP